MVNNPLVRLSYAAKRVRQKGAFVNKNDKFTSTQISRTAVFQTKYRGQN
jgi:hypothetical protein